LRNDAKKNHEELLALLEAHPELTKSDYSSSVSQHTLMRQMLYKLYPDAGQWPPIDVQ
jgi:hypothetical protein